MIAESHWQISNDKTIQSNVTKVIVRKGEREISWEDVRRRLFPKLFRVLSNFYDCFYDSINNRENLFYICFC